MRLYKQINMQFSKLFVVEDTLYRILFLKIKFFKCLGVNQSIYLSMVWLITFITIKLDRGSIGTSPMYMVLGHHLKSIRTPPKHS